MHATYANWRNGRNREFGFVTLISGLESYFQPIKTLINSQEHFKYVVKFGYHSSLKKSRKTFYLGVKCQIYNSKTVSFTAFLEYAARQPLVKPHYSPHLKTFPDTSAVTYSLWETASCL